MKQRAKLKNILEFGDNESVHVLHGMKGIYFNKPGVFVTNVKEKDYDGSDRARVYFLTNDVEQRWTTPMMPQNRNYVKQYGYKNSYALGVRRTDPFTIKGLKFFRPATGMHSIRVYIDSFIQTPNFFTQL